MSSRNRKLEDVGRSASFEEDQAARRRNCGKGVEMTKQRYSGI
jgi:hypothetical protein